MRLKRIEDNKKGKGKKTNGAADALAAGLTAVVKEAVEDVIKKKIQNYIANEVAVLTASVERKMDLLVSKIGNVEKKLEELM
ncbi:hypothetical protein L195_g061143 [Trifolium pratense]|uniref:Uncharacterized protein n=1 Tax=Trifolium pratense TaxID=57577 RepID=A0A2K3K811_TRIPR|nr:hypothetical protein L195_g061143 [Trifolium pratense]